MPIALITGASRGLGLALARHLSEGGWNPIVDGRNGAALEAATADLPGRHRAIAGDIADPVHRHDLLRAVREAGALDLLVNNASTLGPSPLPPLADLPLDDLREVLEVNAVAPLALIQEMLPFLTADGAAIVNITSDAAAEAYEGWGGYGASKAALEQLTAVLAVERPNLHIYAFDPGDMRTQMHQAAFPGGDISDRPEPETVVPALVRLIEELPPNGRYRASDLAAALEARA